MSEAVKLQRPQVDRFLALNSDKGTVAINGRTYVKRECYLHDLHDGDIAGRGASSFQQEGREWGIELQFGRATRDFVDEFQEAASGLTGEQRLAKAIGFVKSHLKYVEDPKAADPMQNSIYADVRNVDDVVLNGDVCIGKSVAFIELFNHDDLLRNEFGKVYLANGVVRHRGEEYVEDHAWAMARLNDKWYVLDVTNGIYGPFDTVSHNNDPAYYGISPTISLYKTTAKSK